MSTEFSYKEDLLPYLPKTPVEVLVQGHNLPEVGTDEYGFVAYGDSRFQILVGEYEEVNNYIQQWSSNISYYSIFNRSRNSQLSLKDLTSLNACVDPGAIICDGATIGEHAHIMMGAVVHSGTQIGEDSIIGMGAVIGQGSIVGKNCSIGANSVLATSSPSSPIVIHDNVKIGPNVTILSGVTIGKDVVIASGSVVNKDVPANAIFAGAPARRVLSADTKEMALKSVSSQK